MRPRKTFPLLRVQLYAIASALLEAVQRFAALLHIAAHCLAQREYTNRQSS
jgi:hypothetical protein